MCFALSGSPVLLQEHVVSVLGQFAQDLLAPNIFPLLSRSFHVIYFNHSPSCVSFEPCTFCQVRFLLTGIGALLNGPFRIQWICPIN